MHRCPYFTFISPNWVLYLYIILTELSKQKKQNIKIVCYWKLFFSFSFSFSMSNPTEGNLVKLFYVLLVLGLSQNQNSEQVQIRWIEFNPNKNRSPRQVISWFEWTKVARKSLSQSFNCTNMLAVCVFAGKVELSFSQNTWEEIWLKIWGFLKLWC